MDLTETDSEKMTLKLNNLVSLLKMPKFLSCLKRSPLVIKVYISIFKIIKK